MGGTVGAASPVMIVTRHTSPESGREAPTASQVRRVVTLMVVGVVGCIAVSLVAGNLIAVLVIVGGLICIAGAMYLWNEPGWLFPLALYVMWFEALPPGPISSGRAVAALAVGIPVARVMTSSWRPPAIQARVWLPTFLLLLWAMVSLLWSDSLGAWLSGFLALFLGIAYMVLFAFFVESPEQLLRLMRPFVITGVVIGLLSALVHYGFGYRSFGFTGGPNDYAALNVEAMPVCVIMALRSKGWWRWFYWLALPVFFVATLAAGSRSGLIAIFVIAFFCAMFRPGMRMDQRIRWGIAALVGSAVAFVIAGILDPTRFSLAGFVSDRGGGRLDIWTAALLGLRNHWFLGYGIGGFQGHALELVQKATGASLNVARQPDFRNNNEIPAHNLFLAVVLDLGLVGVILYFGTMVVAIKNLYDMLKTEWEELAWIGLGVMVVIIATGPFASALNPKMQWAFTGLPAAYFVRRARTDRSRRKSLHVARSVPDGDR